MSHRRASNFLVRDKKVTKEARLPTASGGTHCAPASLRSNSRRRYEGLPRSWKRGACARDEFNYADIYLRTYENIMIIIRDKIEVSLFILFLLACAFLLISFLQLPVIQSIKTNTIYSLLTDDKLKIIVDGLSLSLIAAYIFHIFSNIIPDYKKKRSINIVLNRLVASVLDSYKRVRMFGHETPISHVDITCLDNVWINKEISKNKEGKSTIIPLKFALETAHSRFDDFKTVLPLAVDLSPEHALEWLVLVDKVRLLVWEYENLIFELEKIEEKFNGNLDLIDLKKKEYFEENIGNYRLRFMEFLEKSLQWIDKR